MSAKKDTKTLSLRSFITVTISFTVTIILLCTILFYYVQTASILTDTYKHSITVQLNQFNQQITEQISSIDSIIPLYLSNNLIQNALEASDSNIENSFNIEKQMTYIYYSTSLASKNYTSAIYIICKDNTVFHTNTSASSEPSEYHCQELLKQIDKKEPHLVCTVLPQDDQHLFFIRNLFDGNTGSYMGTFVINVNKERWISYCAKKMEPSWFFCLYNSSVNILSDPGMEKQYKELQRLTDSQHANNSFRELYLVNDDYFVATQNLHEINLTSAVAASKTILLNDLNNTLKSYLFLLTAVILIALAGAIIISHMITRPIDRMIYHINQIADGEQNTLPPMKMYREFDVWANSFNQMLKQLDVYYNDNFQKQLLLKNAEIRALQTQMNPHFLFNVLNTIAWKAQISENEDIYQMVISLGELLKANTLSKEQDYIKLEQEISYVKFYIYLQQMRFEDKISFDFQIPEEFLQKKIPSFCIQPLVENAIVHGLEPKTGKGKLIIQILKTDPGHMEISIIDNGIGFQKIPDIQAICSSEKDSHTHVGLRNLDKRLELLYGKDSCLKIDSIPDVYTMISFCIPFIEEE